MIRQPEEALEHIRESARSGKRNNLRTHVARAATACDLASLAACIESRSLLSLCSDLRESMSPQSFPTFCAVALTAMFSEEELGDYFFDVLVSMHEDEAAWVRRDMKRLYREITGSVYCLNHMTTNPLPRIYHDAYRRRFYLRYRFPVQIRDRAVEAIERREPLAAVCREFEEKYHGSFHDSFLMWLDNAVVEEVGEEAFAAYVRDMVEQYASGLPGRCYLHFSYERLTTYIFGYSRLPVSEFRKYKAIRPHSGCDSYRRLHEILAREMLPYTYAVTQNRTAVYDFLDLSAEERACYDEKAVKVDRSFVPAGLLAAGDSQLAVPELPGGVSFEELLGACDAFFAGKYLAPDSPRGPILPLHRFRRDFKEHLAAEDARMCAAFRMTRRTPALASAFDEHLEGKIAGLRRLMFDGNADDVASDKAEVWIYIPKGETFTGRSVDFSSLGSAGAFQQDAREFLRSLYRRAASADNPRALGRIPEAMGDLLRVLAILGGEYGIARPEDVGELH